MLHMQNPLQPSCLLRSLDLLLLILLMNFWQSTSIAIGIHLVQVSINQFSNQLDSLLAALGSLLKLESLVSLPIVL